MRRMKHTGESRFMVFHSVSFGAGMVRPGCRQRAKRGRMPARFQGASGMAAVGRILWACVVATLLAATVPPAYAQSPVAIGAPLEGPVVLNRDVEVRIGPSQDARIISTMKGGRAVNALGTPRGTTWTQIAIGGQPIGYVPADSLVPVYVPRPVPVAPAPAA